MPRIPAFRDLLRPALLWPLVCFLYFYLSYRSKSYLAGGLVVLAAFYLLYASWERVRKTPLGMVVLAGVALGLPALGLWQAWQLQDMGDLDHADYVQALWNLRRGDTGYSLTNLDIFGTHANYTLVAWIPVQALFGAWALKIGKMLCLLSAAALIFRRFRDQGREASWGAAAFLLSPSIASQFFFGFHPEFLAAPLLVLAFEAYRDANLVRFLVLTALLAYTKEVFTMAIGGILLLALFERRSWKWILLPGLLCCAQMALYWLVIMPHFSQGVNHLTSRFLPSNPADVLSSWFRWKTLQYVLHVTFPFFPLMLALPKRYLLLPVPLMAFYSAFPDPLFMVQWPNYSFPLALLCTAGLVLAKNRRLAEGPEGRGRGEFRDPALDGRILMACTVLALLSYPLWREILSVPTTNGPKRQALSALRAQVPDTASVLLHGPIAVPFAARKEAQMWGLRTSPIDSFQYVILETALPYWLNRPDELNRDIRTLSESPRWSLDHFQDGLYMFRRLAPAPRDSL